jgi:ADP-ribosyl-[dinitrogen reductase] hydrolase
MAMATVTREDRIAGGLLGLLIGDALGVPYEFHPPQSLPAPDRIEMRPPPDFARAHVSVPIGTWSDDGAQALVLLDSLLANDGLDLDDFAAGLRRWLYEGFCAVGGRVFDIGIQSRVALDHLRAGEPAETAGPSGLRDNGNGSLMRVLPLALWHRGGDDELMRLAARQSLPTHGHPRSQIACALYCLWARAELSGAADAWAEAAARLRTLGSAAGFPEAEVEVLLDPAHGCECGGSGYVVDSLWSAKCAVDETADYEACVRRAICFGYDTDTTAAVAGGIAGIRYGPDGIPRRWREVLRGEAILAPLLAGLLARC